MRRLGRQRAVTPLGALARGLLAGRGGTASMTAYQSFIQWGEVDGDGEQAIDRSGAEGSNRMMLPRAQAERCSDPAGDRGDRVVGRPGILARILCRLSEWTLSGCDQPNSVALATRLDVDFDSALALLRRACPHVLAVRILA
jgi:hypothetical protein